MRIQRGFVFVVLAALLLVQVVGCAANSVSGVEWSSSYNWTDRWTEGNKFEPSPGEGAFDVRWHKQITSQWGGDFIPVELATANFDPNRNRIYIGTIEGIFFAFRLSGHTDFVYSAGAAVESAPAVSEEGTIYLTSVDGSVHALRPDGTVQWKVQVSGGSFRNAPVLSDDVAYVVSVDDEVTALARDDGRTLWTYEKEPIEAITIAGHAGILLSEDYLYTAFNDGTIVALNPADGRLIWEIDTSSDVELRKGDAPEFFDINTTPVMLDGTIYVASFNAGLYALDANNGTVQWREPRMRSVVGLALAGDMLVIASARRGIVLFDPETRETRWEHPNERGAPTQPVVTEVGTILYGETQGPLLTLRLSDGFEVARAEGGYGFSADPAVLGRVGAALSNGGDFLCLRIN